MTFIAPFPPGRPPLEAVFLDSDVKASAASSYDFTGMNFGTPNTLRNMFAVFTWSGSAGAVSATGVLIGGVAATQVGSTVVGSDGRNSIATFRALVPSGTSGTVTLSLNGTSTFGTLSIYSVSASSFSVAPFTSTANDPTTTQTVPANGCVIAGATNSSASPPSASWTNLTKDIENSYSLTRTRTTAHRNTTTQLAVLTMTCNFSAGTNGSGIFLVFTPT